MGIEIIEPSAELIGMTVQAEIDPNGVIAYGGCETLIERCGRICYRSEGRTKVDSYKGFIQRIMDRGHGSVLEHASVGIEFTVDRGVSHEMVRHRLASFSQESTRYVKYSDGIKVILPPGLDFAAHCYWEIGVTTAAEAYKDLLDHGVKPEIARAVLPTCLATKIAMTCNLREWLHVLDLRTSEFAHPQIRTVMVLAERILLLVAPTIFNKRGA